MSSMLQFEKIEEFISHSNLIVDKVEVIVYKVILCLGINDVSQNKSESDDINVNAVNSIWSVKYTYPNAKLRVCTILIYNGKGPHKTHG